MQDRVNYRFWDTKERVMLDWDCICQTAFNCTREEGNEIQRYGLMYFVFTTPQRFIPLQCTGLRDKNGKLIYEGDILKVEFPKNKLYPFILATINWDKQKYMLKRINTNVWLPHAAVALRDLKNSTAIGNIYENPELLEENNVNIQP